MTHDKTRCKFVLSTGRTFEPGANRAIGLDGQDLTVGCDMGLRIDGDYDCDGPTAAECVEIADYVIALWTAYRASVQPTGPKS